mmetsp:Transcript_41487/g.95868  ORF Transcript_41487/g.95868 Transcript_41487/m.95868 type:complete len:308 (-) Transcript_41487:321-1244(-)
MFPYPILISMVGVSSSTALAHGLVLSGYHVVSDTKRAAVQGWGYVTRILPVAMFQAWTFSAGNNAYLHLEVGAVEMLKSFAPAAVALVLAVCGVAAPLDRTIVIAVILITFGNVVTVLDEESSKSGAFMSKENSNARLGYALMLVSIFTEAIRLATAQFLLKNCQFSVVEGQYFIGPAASLCLFVTALFQEIPDAIRHNGALFVPMHLLLATAIMGTALNYLGYSVVKTSGSVVLKLLGSIRTMGLVVFSFLFRGEYVGWQSALGYITSVVGMIMLQYSAKKHTDVRTDSSESDKGTQCLQETQSSA